MDNPILVLMSAGVKVPQELNDYRHQLRRARGAQNSDRNDEWAAGEVEMAKAAGPALLALSRMVAAMSLRAKRANLAYERKIRGLYRIIGEHESYIVELEKRQHG